MIRMVCKQYPQLWAVPMKIIASLTNYVDINNNNRRQEI